MQIQREGDTPNDAGESAARSSDVAVETLHGDDRPGDAELALPAHGDDTSGEQRKAP